jgi:hypothetical protein
MDNRSSRRCALKSAGRARAWIWIFAATISTTVALCKDPSVSGQFRLVAKDKMGNIVFQNIQNKSPTKIHFRIDGNTVKTAQLKLGITYTLEAEGFSTSDGAFEANRLVVTLGKQKLELASRERFDYLKRHDPKTDYLLF